MGRPPQYPPGHPLESDYMKAKRARDPHSQRIPFNPDAEMPVFTGAQFVGFVNASSMKFTKNNQLVFEITVQPEHVDEALMMRPVLSQSIPLSIDVQVWHPYAEKEQEDAAKLILFERKIETSD